MILKQVKVFAPATIANVGPGFDVLGIALEEPGDIIVAERSSTEGLHFTLGKSVYPTPTLSDNVAAHVAEAMLQAFKPPFGINMSLYKNMPIGSGLGSSGASCAAAALAVNALLPTPLPKSELIQYAMQGEHLASGSEHADNVAPALLGGACLIRSYDPLDVIQLPIKNNVFWVVAHPDMVIATQTARALLPDMIPLKQAIAQWGNLAGLVIGLCMGDTQLISRSMVDVLIEPLRMQLIPGFNEVKQAALDAGALGFSISGSGPSVFAVTQSKEIAEEVASAIKEVFTQIIKVNCEIYISRINVLGAHILEHTS